MLNVITLKDALKEYFDVTDTNEAPNLNHISWGFENLDKTFGPLKVGLTFILGIEGVGKSNFAYNICLNAAKEVEGNILIFSSENPDTVINRLLSITGHVQACKIKEGTANDEDWARASCAVDSLLKRKIHICNSEIGSTKSLDTIFGAYKPKLVIIDDIKLFKSSENKINCEDITRQLSAIAKNYNVPVLLIGQLGKQEAWEITRYRRLPNNSKFNSLNFSNDGYVFLHENSHFNKPHEYVGVTNFYTISESGQLKIFQLEYNPKTGVFYNYLGYE